MQLLEHTQECEPKYDLWPYKRWNTEGSITKNYRCVDLTMMHIQKAVIHRKAQETLNFYLSFQVIKVLSFVI